MSSLINSAKLTQIVLKNNAVFLTAVRHHWNKDYKPGPYPRNEEERIRAAKKYGLHPSEYQPYPDDGSGWGDYPKLPEQSADSKDPHYPWDFPDAKRNFNEPMHVDYDLMREDRYDVSFRHRLAPWILWAQFFAAMGGSLLIYHLFDKVKMFHPVTPQQYPRDGPHYTFEPKE